MALGGYFGSRLMSNIREEKGLTYGISASLCGNYEGAYVEIDAQCDASFVEQVVEESRKEIASLWENPPRDEELHRIKLRVWSSLASIADTPFATSDYYITRRIVGTTDSYFQDQMEALKNLTSHRIAEIAKKHLNPDALTVAIAGPC
jgi:predicted Zn-dependent peptidase